jgi:hypothetical protein
MGEFFEKNKRGEWQNIESQNVEEQNAEGKTSKKKHRRVEMSKG